MREEKASIFIFMIMTTIFLLPSPVVADVLYYYPGPSELSGHGLRVWEFRITGPSPLKVGDTIDVQFKLQNSGLYNVTLAELGVFATARDPGLQDASFGFTHQNQTFLVGQNVTCQATKSVDKPGVWKIWPSYQVWWPPTFVKPPDRELGPDEWHAASLTVVPSLPDLVVAEMSCAPIEPKVGDDVKVTVLVKNIGNATAGACQGALLVSDKTVASVSVPSLLVAETKSLALTWTPTDEGTQVVGFDVDVDDIVDEADESNNIMEVTVTVAARLPDLVVNEIKDDRENDRIGYVIKNIGEAVAKAGHSTTLYVLGEEVTHDLVPIDLDVGDTYESWFQNYTWPLCQTISVKVCADNYNQVRESNEENNYLEKVCESYMGPLRIISGPRVTTVTETSAVISWVTNERSNSQVAYTYSLGKYSSFVKDPDQVREHLVVLNGLTSDTTYHFYVKSEDACGNIVKSRGRTFETLFPTDAEKPSVKLFLSKTLLRVVEISATASDNVGVSRVIFSIDGILKFTDYSPPFIWKCNTADFASGVHIFGATAFDKAENKADDFKDGTIKIPLSDTGRPSINILSPHDGDYVFRGIVPIEFLVEDLVLAGEPQGFIQKVEVYIDGAFSWRSVYNPFRYDVLTGDFVSVPPESSVSLAYYWNTEELEPGSEHRIEVKAWDDSTNYGFAIVRVKILKVEAAPPTVELVIVKVEVTREVYQYENWFDVYLSIKNTGNKVLDHFVIEDLCTGFQAIALPAPSTSLDTTVQFKPDLRASKVIIRPLTETLNPGEVWTFHYYVLPILFSPFLPNEEYIVGVYTSVSFSSEGGRHQQTFSVPYLPFFEDTNENNINDLDDALWNADYVIITDPNKLFSFNPNDADAIYLLLQESATLARIKHGVLGYLDGQTAEQIRDLISPAGDWQQRLNSAFGMADYWDAYLLIVGETEIVPSFTLPTDMFLDSTQGLVELSDNPYADTIFNDGAPDVIVGRIIGDSAINLVKPVQSSIEVALGSGFNRWYAIAISGYEDGPGDVFESEILDAAEDLSDQGNTAVWTLFWSAWVEDEWNVPFTNYDAFALGDVDQDQLDEIIIAKDEESRIYIYEPDGSFKNSFQCRFTKYDGFAAGDLDGDGIDEIVIAVDDDGPSGMIYIYNPDGTLVCQELLTFSNWDPIAVGDVAGDSKEEIISYHDYGDGYREVHIDRLDDDHLESVGYFHADFSSYDVLAVGNVRMDWPKDEIVIIRDDDKQIYIYNKDGTLLTKLGDLDNDGTNDVRFTHYDGFALGDVDEDREDEMLVIVDEAEKIYHYYWDGWWDKSTGRYVQGTKWKTYAMYSRFLSDWFHGIRYTGCAVGFGTTDRHDGFAIGKVQFGENPKIIILRNRNGDTSSLYTLASTWEEADEWANVRLSSYTSYISVLVVSGHGNPWGASPIGADWANLYQFSQHPFVIAFSCLSGYYEDDTSLGEALFDRGAAIFIGSTEVSGISDNHEVIINYFNRFYPCCWDIWNSLESAGECFRDYERSRVFTGKNWWKFWVEEYNYYGDPKFPLEG